MATIGLGGAAEHQYQHCVHQKLAAISSARNHQAHLDEVIRIEHHKHSRTQESVRETRGRAECAVASADNDRQRAHQDMQYCLTECELFDHHQQTQRADIADHQQVAQRTA